MFDLDSLRVFVTAAEQRSFTRAAVALGVAQPTISRVVKELEDEWGEALFHRTGRGVEVSAFGRVALERARALLRDVDQTAEDLRALKARPSGDVSLGLPPSMVGVLLPGIVRDLQEAAPGVRLRIREGFSDRVEHWLTEGSVEVGVFSKYCEDGQRVEPALYTSPLMLARAATAGPLPATVDFAELAGKPLVLPTPPNGLRMIVEATARRLRLRLDVRIDVDSISAQRLIAEGCGYYMVKAAHTLSDGPARERFAVARIVNPALLRYIVLQTTQARPLTRAGREVATRIRAAIRALPPNAEASGAGPDAATGS